MFLFLSVFVVCVFVYLFFCKFVQFYEYKHCLNCPLKKDEEPINFDVFREDIKREREEYEKKFKL